MTLEQKYLKMIKDANLEIVGLKQEVIRLKAELKKARSNKKRENQK